MNKTIISLARTSVAIFAAIAMTACGFEGKSITGSGNVVTMNRDIKEDFTKIDVEKGLEVVVEQSNVKAVMVEADDNLQSHIHTTVSNGTLKITSDYGNYNNVKSKKIIVKMPVIRELNTSSGSKITSGNALKGDDLTMSTSSGSEMVVEVEADKVSCSSSSGSHITISGKALTLRTESSSGSEIDAGKLLVNEVDSESSSGSSTEVHPIVSLEARASSGSSIQYFGDPGKIDKKASSGGNISAH